LEELVSGLLRPKLFPFGKLSKAKPAAHWVYKGCQYGIYLSLKTSSIQRFFFCQTLLTTGTGFEQAF
jgi:hypothetical protein